MSKELSPFQAPEAAVAAVKTEPPRSYRLRFLRAVKYSCHGRMWFDGFWVERLLLLLDWTETVAACGGDGAVA